MISIVLRVVLLAIALLVLRGELAGVAPADRPVVAALVTLLLVYRVIYYLLPLCGAVSLSGIAEMIRSRRHLVRQDTAALRDVRVDLTAADAI